MYKSKHNKQMIIVLFRATEVATITPNHSTTYLKFVITSASTLRRMFVSVIVTKKVMSFII